MGRKKRKCQEPFSDRGREVNMELHSTPTIKTGSCQGMKLPICPHHLLFHRPLITHPSTTLHTGNFPLIRVINLEGKMKSTRVQFDLGKRVRTLLLHWQFQSWMCMKLFALMHTNVGNSICE